MAKKKRGKARLAGFCYVDTAFGGANRRGWDKVNKRSNVKRLADIPRRLDMPDCYRGVFLFDKRLADYVEEHHHAKGVGELPHTTDRIYWDFDNKGDLAKVFKDMDQVWDNVEAKLGAEAAGTLVLWFSGRGGQAELPIPLDTFGEPSKDYHFSVEVAALALAGNVDIDVNVYNADRLWRLPNTLNGKSGKWKTRLTPEQVKKLAEDPGPIAELAGTRRGDVTTSLGKPASGVAEKLRAVVASAPATGVDKVLPVFSVDSSDEKWALGDEFTLAAMLADPPVEEGERNKFLYSASCLCRNIDLGADEALELLDGCVSLGRNEFRVTVLSAYANPQYRPFSNILKRYAKGLTDMVQIEVERLSKIVRADKSIMDKLPKPVHPDDIYPYILWYLVYGSGKWEAESPWRKIVTSYMGVSGYIARHKDPRYAEKTSAFTYKKCVTLLFGKSHYAGKTTMTVSEAAKAVKNGKIPITLYCVGTDEQPSQFVTHVERFPILDDGNFVVCTPMSTISFCEAIWDSTPNNIVIDTLVSFFVDTRQPMPKWSEQDKVRELFGQFRMIIFWTNIIAHVEGIGCGVDSIQVNDHTSSNEEEVFGKMSKMPSIDVILFLQTDPPYTVVYFRGSRTGLSPQDKKNWQYLFDYDTETHKFVGFVDNKKKRVKTSQESGDAINDALAKFRANGVMEVSLCDLAKECRRAEETIRRRFTKKENKPWVNANAVSIKKVGKVWMITLHPLKSGSATDLLPLDGDDEDERKDGDE